LVYSGTWSSWDLDSIPIILLVAAAAILFLAAADFPIFFLFSFAFSVFPGTHFESHIGVADCNIEKHELKDLKEL